MVDEEIGMPAKRELSMRQLRHLLRLHHDGVSAREIGRRLGVARSTIQDNLKRAAAAGLAWPLAEGVTEDALERQLFGRAGVAQGQRRRAEPDWAALARELKRPGVTMTILWEEYREIHPEGYGYSRFCDLLRGFERRLTPVMRQHHVAGEKAFVDYSGRRIGIADPTTGEIREAEIFVGVLGASNLTYAEATWTQTLPDWTGAHVRMFRFFGGAPKLLVPDNLKSGVNKASFYDPEINRTYGAMAAHYSVGLLPARPRRPRDKAKVEAGVRFAQTYILGRLRHLTFFSLAECNAAITLVMQRMNERPMRNLGLSRRELFETIERAALIALPADDWEFAEWRRARVNLDYHIEVHDFLYSVPHALIRAEVDVRITARTVEIFHRGQRVGAHQRRTMGRKHGTDPDHMPSSHRRYADWTPDRFRRWAGKIGPNTEGLISAVLASRPHPEQGFRTCLGILRSYRGLDPARLEAVSARAVELGVLNCKGVASLLARKPDHAAAAKDNRAATLFDHANLRGPGYYH
jgi:transposase